MKAGNISVRRLSGVSIVMLHDVLMMLLFPVITTSLSRSVLTGMKKRRSLFLRGNDVDGVRFWHEAE